MNMVLVWIGVAAVIAYLYYQFSTNGGSGRIEDLKVRWPVYKKSTLSPVEQRVYRCISGKVGGVHVFPQVSMCSIVEVENNRSNPKFWAMFNRFSKMSVDFLVCDHRFNVICAIEIDDASHQQERRQQADKVKNHVLKSAGIPLIRWHVSNLPDEHAMIKEIKNLK